MKVISTSFITFISVSFQFSLILDCFSIINTTFFLPWFGINPEFLFNYKRCFWICNGGIGSIKYQMIVCVRACCQILIMFWNRYQLDNVNWFELVVFDSGNWDRLIACFRKLASHFNSLHYFDIKYKFVMIYYFQSSNNSCLTVLKYEGPLKRKKWHLRASHLWKKI